jgi:hypothetical protein
MKARFRRDAGRVAPHTLCQYKQYEWELLITKALEQTISKMSPSGNECFKAIRFDSDFRTKSRHKAAAKDLAGQVKHWKNMARAARRQDMRRWRIFQRNWEMDVFINEWNNGNSVILAPDVTRNGIEETIQSLRRDNAADRRGEIPTEYIARRFGLVIRNPRKHRSSPILPE